MTWTFTFVLDADLHKIPNEKSTSTDSGDDFLWCHDIIGFVAPHIWKNCYNILSVFFLSPQ